MDWFLKSSFENGMSILHSFIRYLEKIFKFSLNFRDVLRSFDHSISYRMSEYSEPHLHTSDLLRNSQTDEMKYM